MDISERHLVLLKGFFERQEWVQGCPGKNKLHVGIGFWETRDMTIRDAQCEKQSSQHLRVSSVAFVTLVK